VAVDAVPKSTQHTWVAEVRVGSSKYKISVVDTAAAAVAAAAKFDKGTHTSSLASALFNPPLLPYSLLNFSLPFSSSY
jgi:hypothetical protein